MCWLLKCCFSARANRQKGEVDEESFLAGAPCLLQLLPEIRSGSREIARLAWLGLAGLCGALLCCAEPGQAEHVHSSLRGVTPLAAGHPREFKKKKALFPRCTLEMSFFTNQPCLTKTIRAPLESPAEGQGLAGLAGVWDGAPRASHLWLIPLCPWRGHRTCPHSAAPRLPSALWETRILSRLQCYSSAKTVFRFVRDQRGINISFFPPNISSLICVVFLLWKGAICKKK